MRRSAPDGQVKMVIEDHCKHYKYPLSHIVYEGDVCDTPWYTVYIKKGARKYKEVTESIKFAVRFLGISIAFKKNKEFTR